MYASVSNRIGRYLRILSTAQYTITEELTCRHTGIKVRHSDLIKPDPRQTPLLPHSLPHSSDELNLVTHFFSFTWLVSVE